MTRQRHLLVSSAMSDVIPGAEPFEQAGGPIGVLVVHGFTGSPSSMRPIATAMAEAGHTVHMPRLPGHGTSVTDMLETSWADWSGTVEAAYQEMSQSCEKVVVVGLSMGGTLTLELASKHPEIAGIVAINAPSTTNATTVDQVRGLMQNGETLIDSIGNDIAKPDIDEGSYDATPIGPLLSLFDAVEALQPNLVKIKMPTLLITSRQDHVVPPSDSDNTATAISCVAERLWLEDSYHVATIDYDRDNIIDTLSKFVNRVTAKAEV